MHLLWAAACVATKSPPEAITAIFEPDHLKLEHFTKNGLEPLVPINDKTISEAIDKALLDEDGMYDATFIKVIWWVNYMISAADIFEADRVKSAGIMEGKLATSHPSAGAMLGS